MKVNLSFNRLEGKVIRYYLSKEICINNRPILVKNLKNSECIFDFTKTIKIDGRKAFIVFECFNSLPGQIVGSALIPLSQLINGTRTFTFVQKATTKTGPVIGYVDIEIIEKPSISFLTEYSADEHERDRALTNKYVSKYYEFFTNMNTTYIPTIPDLQEFHSPIYPGTYMKYPASIYNSKSVKPTESTLEFVRHAANFENLTLDDVEVLISKQKNSPLEYLPETDLVCKILADAKTIFATSLEFVPDSSGELMYPARSGGFFGDCEDKKCECAFCTFYRGKPNIAWFQTLYVHATAIAAVRFPGREMENHNVLLWIPRFFIMSKTGCKSDYFFLYKFEEDLPIIILESTILMNPIVKCKNEVLLNKWNENFRKTKVFECFGGDKYLYGHSFYEYINEIWVDMSQFTKTMGFTVYSLCKNGLHGVRLNDLVDGQVELKCVYSMTQLDTEKFKDFLTIEVPLPDWPDYEKREDMKGEYNVFCRWYSHMSKSILDEMTKKFAEKDHKKIKFTIWDNPLIYFVEFRFRV